MSEDLDSITQAREGLLRERSDAIETIRGWVAGLVFGARWKLDDPEAVIQDVILRLLHLGRTGRIRSDTDFKAFVHTVARHTCTDAYRRERLRGGVETGVETVEHHAAEDGDPHEDLEERERGELLQFIFQALPDECRRMWQWVYEEGLAAADVGQKLGITAVNARVRLHRCMTRAREIRDQYALGAARTVEANGHGG